MSDIIASVPWQCSDSDCTVPGGWHKGSYWYDTDDGTFSYDEFSDGDHEDAQESDLPSPEDEVKAWAEYRLWALEHQADPLGEFMYGVPSPDSVQAATIRREAASTGALP